MWVGGSSICFGGNRNSIEVVSWTLNNLLVTVALDLLTGSFSDAGVSHVSRHRVLLQARCPDLLVSQQSAQNIAFTVVRSFKTRPLQSFIHVDIIVIFMEVRRVSSTDSGGNDLTSRYDSGGALGERFLERFFQWPLKW